MKLLIVFFGIVVLILGLTAGGVVLGLRAHRKRSVKGSQPDKGRTQRKTTERLRLPYRYDHEAVFVHRNAVWTGVKLDPVSEEFVSSDELLTYAQDATRGLEGLVSRSKVNVHVRVTHRPMDTESWSENLLRNAWSPTRMYRSLVAYLSLYLSTVKRTMVPTTYVLVQIDQIDPSIIKASMSEALMGGDDELIPPELAAKWQTAAETVQRKLGAMTRHGRGGGGVGFRSITRDDRMWLIRKPLTGHFTPRMDDFPQAKPWGQGEYNLWVDFHAFNGRRGLEISMLAQDLDDVDRDDETEEVKSHTACLVVADWPDETHVETQWIRWFSRMGLEVSYRATVMPYTDYQGQMKKISRNLRAESKQVEKAGRDDEGDDVFEERVQAQAALKRVRDNRSPGVRGQIMLQVSAPTRTRLDLLVERVISEAKDNLDIRLVRTGRYQWRMIESILPGDGPSSVLPLPYVRLTDTDLLGTGFARGGAITGDGVETKLGDSSTTLGWLGDYIGQTASGAPVFHAPHSAIARAGGGGIVLVGSSGGGKSSLALLLFFYASESGVRTRVIDPKVDFAAFVYYVSFGPQVNEDGFDEEADLGILGTPESKFQPVNQQFWEDTEIIDIVRSKAGRFEPWQVTQDIEDGALMASQVLEISLGSETYKTYQSKIDNAIEAVKVRWESSVAELAASLEQDLRIPAMDAEKRAQDEIPLPTLWSVLDEVEARAAKAHEDPNADLSFKDGWESAVTQLRKLRKGTYSRLLFAENPEAGQHLAHKRRVIYTLRGMTFPKTSNAKFWGQQEQRAAAILYVLVSELSRQMPTEQKVRNPVTGEIGAVPKLLIVDESYILTAIELGANLLQTTLAQGRSYNYATLLIDQNARRLGAIESSGQSDDPSSNQIQTLFAFRQRSKEDARKVIPMLSGGDSVTSEKSGLFVDALTMTETGECVMRNFDSQQTGLMVDLVFSELLAATDTTAKTRPLSQSRPISADPFEWTLMGMEQRQEHIKQASEAEVETDAAADDVSAEAHDSAGQGEALKGEALKGDETHA